MCFEKKHEQITEYPLYLHEDEKGNTEIIGRKGRKGRRVEMGGGMPEGGEPYQQLVTDGEGAAVWEDRLAYSEPEREIYSASQVEFMTQTAGTGEQYFEAVVSSIALEEGAEYRLMVDGEFVSNEYFECASMNYKGLYFGDGLLAWAEELHRYNDGTRGYCVTEEYIFLINFAPGPHDIAVYKVEETVHKIDPKYLPEGVGGGMVVTFTYNSDDDVKFTADKAFEEVWQELRAGKNVIGLMVSESGDMITGNTLPVAVYASANISDKPGHRMIAFGTASLLGNRASMITMKFYDDESVAQETMRLAPYVS